MKLWWKRIRWWFRIETMPVERFEATLFCRGAEEWGKRMAAETNYDYKASWEKLRRRAEMEGLL